MIEEKNDNLSPENMAADGNLENINTENPDNQEVLEGTTQEESVAEESETQEVSEEITQEETIAEESETQEVSEEITQEETIAESSENQEVSEEKTVIEENVETDAIKTINESNAEESEDETLRERDNHPMRDYSVLSMEELTDELEKLSKTEKIMSVREHVDEIKKEFTNQYNHFIEEKKEEFLVENTEEGQEFEYHFPLKDRFDTLYKEIKQRQNTHFKNIQNNLKSNLEKRLAIVEEIKNLINPQENIKDTLKYFNELRDQWRAIGSIPRDKYNHVWNNYHFHVENFYDYLHLDREARDLDFRHNLEQKQKIIERVKELVHEEDIVKAFRELQDLHKIWKEEIGPVDREYREQIWNEFSELTKQIHDKRELFFNTLKEREYQNLEVKKSITAEIKKISEQQTTAHSQWQQQIKRIEELRKDFFATGRVPADLNEETWSSFKDAVREFNHQKNNFYKEIKKEQNDNLNKKLALVEKAQSLQDSEDFETVTPIMKQIQEEWKQIGHVPRKFSDKIWDDFKTACNHYFDKLKAQRKSLDNDEIIAFDKKKDFLVQLKSFELTGNHKTDLDAVKAHIEEWKKIGKVPFSRRHIEGKFNKILDALFEKLSLSKKESEMMRFSNRLEELAGSEDTKRLENEKIFIMRKIDEIQGEIFQLENNIQFFANADKNNPLVKEVYKNIERQKEELNLWKEKLKQVKKIG
ncbi:MAG: DUF349 domain-containing protein [Flavobacteriaceae bacterium]|jgi:hypothetical protein|nr:DUF349 domain-containing protein [Flavobacteriaceae bacterium]